MSAVWNFLFGWCPTLEIRTAFAGLLALAVVFIVLRIVKIVLDALPFL